MEGWDGNIRRQEPEARARPFTRGTFFLARDRLTVMANDQHWPGLGPRAHEVSSRGDCKYGKSSPGRKAA